MDEIAKTIITACNAEFKAISRDMTVAYKKLSKLEKSNKRLSKSCFLTGIALVLSGFSSYILTKEVEELKKDLTKLEKKCYVFETELNKPMSISEKVQ